MTLRCLVLGLPLVGLALPACAQQATPSSGAFQLHEAVGAPDWLTLAGTIRPRLEILSNPFVAGQAGDQVFLGVTSTLFAEAKSGAFVMGGELLDARLVAENGGAAATEIDTLEIAQAYLAWRPDNLIQDGDRLDLMAGRFAMDVGSRRLVARPLYRSLVTHFEGGRALWRSGGGVELTAFHVAPLVRQPSDAPSALDNEVADNVTASETAFAGLHVSAPLPARFIAELYVLDLDESDAADLPSRDRDLLTTGGRLHRDPAVNAFDLDLEWARQTGTLRASASPAALVDLDHDAVMGHAEIGYTFAGAHRIRVAAMLDIASGDENPSDLLSQRFDPLFGDRAFEFGPTSLYGAIARSNLVSPGVRIEARLDKASEMMAMVRHIGLDEPRDSFANSGVRDVSGLSGDDVGTQLELRYRRWLIPDSLRLQAGLAWIAQGGFLETAPNATGQGDPLYSYIQTSFAF